MSPLRWEIPGETQPLNWWVIWCLVLESPSAFSALTTCRVHRTHGRYGFHRHGQLILWFSGWFQKSQRFFLNCVFLGISFDVFPSRNNAAWGQSQSPCSGKNPSASLPVRLVEDFRPVSSQPQAAWWWSFYFWNSKSLLLALTRCYSLYKFLGHGREIPWGSACHFLVALTSPKSQSEQAVCSKLAMSSSDLGEDFPEISPEAWAIKAQGWERTILLISSFNLFTACSLLFALVWYRLWIFRALLLRGKQIDPPAPFYINLASTPF